MRLPASILILLLAFAVDGRAESTELDPWEDLTGTPARWWQHVRGVAEPVPLITLATGAGGAWISSELWDDDIAREVAERGEALPPGLNDGLDLLGNPAVHLGATALLYGTSLLVADEELHALALDLGDALMIGSFANFSFKLAFDTTRPNGDPRGFPSGHAESSFAVATVLARHFGGWVGVPAYGLAALVAYHRIDTRKHDLSDVIFGAALGITVGWITTAEADATDALRLVPFVDPLEGHRGLALEWRW